MSSQTRLTVVIFSTQLHKYRLDNAKSTIIFLLPPLQLKIQREKIWKKEKQKSSYKFKDLEELLYFKTKKMSNYGYILAYKLNYYHHYGIV